MFLTPSISSEWPHFLIPRLCNILITLNLKMQAEWSSKVLVNSCKTTVPLSRLQSDKNCAVQHEMSKGSGTGSTQSREDNWGATWMKKYWLRSRKPRLMAAGNRCADHATPSIRKGCH
jgi:hypothetical protein